MQSKSFVTSIFYSQIMIYEKGYNNPGLRWTDDCVKQGFAYMEKSVAFGLPDCNGECFVRVQQVESGFNISDDILWAIAVPFIVSTGSISIATVMGEELFYDLDKGVYELTFSVKNDPQSVYPYILDFYFYKNIHADFKILRSCSIQGGATVDKVLSKTVEIA